MATAELRNPCLLNARRARSLSFGDGSVLLARWPKHLPEILAQFRTAENQLGSVLSWIDAKDLCPVREVYPEGVADEVLSSCLEDMRRRRQSEARIEEVARALEGLSTRQEVSRVEVEGSLPKADGGQVRGGRSRRL